MAGQALANLIARGELIGSAVLVVIGVALIALAPGKKTVSELPVWWRRAYRLGKHDVGSA